MKTPQWVHRMNACGQIISQSFTYKTTTIILWLFVWDYPGESVPEETFTHPPS